jgi:hypothetical protein
MPTRSRTTFKKRQKELARMEKQRDKAARRLQRKLDPKETGEVEPTPDAEATDDLLAGVDAESSAKSL